MQPRQHASTNPKMPTKITTPAGITLDQVPNWYDGNRAVYEDDTHQWRIVPHRWTPSRKRAVSLVYLTRAIITEHPTISSAAAAIDRLNDHMQSSHAEGDTAP